MRTGLLYGRSSIEGFTQRRVFEDVKFYCMFVGYPRSGHSLVGSLLDAHPNMVLAHELDALRYLAAGFSRNQIFWLILQREVEFGRAGRTWRGFDYSVPNQWQGRFERIFVIGDKKGGRSTVRLRDAPQQLAQLKRTIGLPIKLIHVTRNPFDNIATMTRRGHERHGHASLKEFAEAYFSRCEAVSNIELSHDAEDVIHFKLEALIQDPQVALTGLCEFLGVEAIPDYLRACREVVFGSPHKSRYEMPWTPELVREVEYRMSDFAFLAEYSFDD
jgi:hypothetical protein